MYTVYALRSTIKNYIYVGMTKDLDDRIRRHNAGYNKSTSPYKPFILIYQEILPNGQEARKREKYFNFSIV